MKYLLLISLIGLSAPALAMDNPQEAKHILMQAAKTGNTDVIAWLYSPESGILIDVDTKDEEGLTPLHLASRENHPETVLKLIEIGARVDTFATPPRELEMLMPLLAAMGLQIGQLNGPTPLHLARSLEVAALLVVHGANIEAVGPLGGTPLFPAIICNNKEIVQFLLEQGADTENLAFDGSKILGQAILFGKQEIIRLLVDKGADLNNVANNKSAQYIAALCGDLAVVSFLMSQGADISETSDEDETLLHVAALGMTRADLFNQAGAGQMLPNDLIMGLPASNHKGVIAYLLDNGLDVYAMCDKGTALHTAAHSGKPELCETLLKSATYANLKEDSEANYQRMYCVFLCFQRLNKEGQGLGRDVYGIIFSLLGREILSGALNTSTLESFSGDLTRRCKKILGLNYPVLILAYCVKPARKLLSLQNKADESAADSATTNGHEELATLLDPDQSDDVLLKQLFDKKPDVADQKGKEEEDAE